MFATMIFLSELVSAGDRMEGENDEDEADVEEGRRLLCCGRIRMLIQSIERMHPHTIRVYVCIIHIVYSIKINALKRI